jgi:hypothetical protein
MHDPIHTTECEVIYTHAYVHANIPNTNTRASLAHIPTFIPVHSAIVHTMHKRAPLIRTHASKQAMCCTHVSVWSVELWASAAAMCCAPSTPVPFSSRLYAHVYVRKPIQRTCVAHDARSHKHNRVRGHIHPCIRARRYAKYKPRTCLARIPIFIPVHNEIVHTTHSCEQAMCCTHLSVCSVELWASAAAMCCAPSTPMGLWARPYAHVCLRRTIQRTCVAHDARSHIHNRARDNGHMHADCKNYICWAYCCGS